MSAACWVEALKMRRAVVVRVATVSVVVLPALLAAGLIRAAGSGAPGALSAKASALVVGQGWPGYLDLVIQVEATAGLLGVGITAAWCFGREFADRTVTSGYAVAIGRHLVAAAKFAVLAVWSTGVAVLSLVVTVAVGWLSGLGTPADAHLPALGRLGILSLATGALGLTVALFASAGRGYLAGFAGLLGLIVSAQLAAFTVAGSWYPYSAPALWAMNAGPAASLLVVAAFVAATGSATVLWWRRAEVV